MKERRPKKEINKKEKKGIRKERRQKKEINKTEEEGKKGRKTNE